MRSGSSSSSASVAWPFLLRATRASVASISGSPSSARLARVERLAGTAARLFSTSPPCASRCNVGERFEAGALVGVEVAAGYEVVGQAPGLVAGPGLEGEHELALVDQAVLKREQSEEEMAVGGGGHGMAPNSGGRSGAGPSLGAGPGIESRRSDYRKSAMPLHLRRGMSSDGVDRSS